MIASLKNSENQNVEFKAIWKDEYLKWICGFANAKGGKLFIGVNDNAEAIGLKNYSKLLEDLPNKINNILGLIVDVNLLTDNGKNYIEIVVDSYKTPISYKGHIYYRSGSTLQDLYGPALEKMLLKKMGKHWDGIIVENFSTDDLSSVAFDIFRKKARRSKRIPIEDLQENDKHLLELLGLTENGSLTRAAVLAFGKNPEKLVTGAYVKIGFFRTHGDLLYHDEIHGSLLEQVEKTMDLLTTKYMRANIAYEGITRTETYDFPEDALREAVLNAVIHNDYTSGSPVQISVYDKMIWISNSGNLPQGWTVETLKKHHKSEPPNPDIANAFFRAGYIEVWGRGTLNIVNYCKNAGLPEPDFHFTSGLTVLFKKENKTFNELASIDYEKTAEKTTEKSSEKGSEKSSEKIILLIKKEPGISAKKLSELLGISSRAVEKHIKNLKNKNILKRIGPDKGGHWKIIDNE